MASISDLDLSTAGNIKMCVIRRTTDGTDHLENGGMFPFVVDLLSNTTFSEWMKKGYYDGEKMVETTGHYVGGISGKSVNDIRDKIIEMIPLLKGCVEGKDRGVHQCLVDNLKDDTKDILVYTHRPSECHKDTWFFSLVSVSIGRKEWQEGLIFKTTYVMYVADCITRCGVTTIKE